MSTTISKLLTTSNGLARRSDVDRHVILRLIAQGVLVPDGILELGEQQQPVFFAERAVDVLRASLPSVNLRRN